ncbi:hypothetical protein FJT64_009489 [Amphibalanus amphitrite]|uniref:Uncharacterized protein n=1 Tax=Amphibalanus amphitrite TaxID=1232801 RepID=A0A6A4VQZ5_AMPAM|nr:hypothetical protein FJT64_009489 [Amphibalanus amphitrite]
MQEWERKRSGGPCRVAEEHEARPERRSRKEEVERQRKVTQWEIAKALAGKSQQNVEQLQKHLPSEFNKKYEEWRLKMKMAEVKAGHGAPTQGQVSPGSQKRRAAELRRQTRTKDLQWLERELQKVSYGIESLLNALERVRDAMRRPKEDKEDKVTIKTAEGEFRFEGINKNFTKKLYEWEERRGKRK